MKLTFLFMLVACLQVSAGVKAQDITFSKRNISLEKVFMEIRNQTGYEFLYNTDALNRAKKIDLRFEHTPLKEALNEVFKDQPLTYDIIGKTIVVRGKEDQPVTKMEEPVLIQIKGTVVDSATGSPLVGVTIRVRGGTMGTVSNGQGKFSLNVPENAVLEISYLGYDNKVIKVEGRNDITIRLPSASTNLNQLVVVGYGTEKKADLTGAVSTVDTKQLENRPLPNLSQSLQGLVPGVTVQRNSGGIPGSSGTITIRGATSLNSSGPLVLIDGIPGSIDNINPNDVASISVLKDAASTAIYGARAAEGVILITTKSGSFNQPMKISYQANFSLQRPGHYPAVNNSVDNATLGNLAFTNAGGAPLYPQEQINFYKDPKTIAYPNANNTDWIYVANTNWPKLLFNNSLEQSHQLAISGGSKNISYRVSGDLLYQEGMFAKYGPDNFGRKTLRADLSAELIPSKLKMKIGIDYFNSKKLLPSVGYGYLMSTIEQIGPTIPVYNPDGTWARFKQQQSPIQLLEEAGFDNTYTDQLTARINLSWNITKEFSVEALGGYVINYDREKKWDRAYSKYTPKGITNTGYINGPNSVTMNNDYAGYSTGQILANYDKTIAGAHHFHLLVGSSIEEQKESSLSAFRDNIPGNNLPALNIGSNKNWTNGASAGSWAIVSGFSRLNYNYKEKYLIEANVRMDGSSRFSNEHRWGTFPSVSAAWRISNESFMKDQHIFSNLKLRLSWGEIGNQNGLGLYDYIPVYNIGGYYPFGGGNLGQWAISPELASQDRTWETVVVKNIGIDVGFLRNRLTITADYFEKRNRDMLINIQVPSIIGITVPTDNFGVLETKGWDAEIDWKDNLSNNFQYSVSFNLSNANDKLVSIATPFANPTAGIINLQGYPLNSIFGYQAGGYFQTQDEISKWAVQNPAVNAPGDIKYVDQNGDGKISSPQDLIYMGNTTPHYTFGLNLALSWRNIDFSAFFQGVGERLFYFTDGNPGIAPFIHSWDNYSFKFQNNYWTTSNPNALFPRPYEGAQNYQWSTHWLQNTAYARVKNIQVGYSLPKAVISKIKASEIRIYFSGEDIWTWTKLAYPFDPEISNTSGYYYPTPEGYSLGLNVTF